MACAYEAMYAYGLIKAMHPKQSNLAQARATYIPPRVQQEMARHMQQTLPANLKHYQDSGGYIPPNIQKQMAQHMQASMPEHLKQFIDPYMQQKVAPQYLSSMSGAHPTPMAPHAQVTFHPDDQPLHITESHTPAHSHEILQAETTQPAVPQPQVSNPVDEPYSFITNPPSPAKPLLNPFSGQSLLKRAVLLGGGLVVFVIIIFVLRSLTSPNFSLPPYLTLLQDQQELIHLSTTAAQSSANQTLSEDYQNFIATTQVTVTSAQTQLLSYLALNKQKVTNKEIDLKVSLVTDNQLTASQASGSYTSTFQTVMAAQLNTYLSDLHQAYVHTSGVKGHTQINNDYSQALLLVKQLNQANDGSGS